MIGLTPRQAELFAFIRQQIGAGQVPSLSEMAAHMKTESKSGVHAMLVALEERGLIRRLHNRARAIELIGDPWQLSQAKVALLNTYCEFVGRTQADVIGEALTFFFVTHARDVESALREKRLPHGQ